MKFQAVLAALLGASTVLGGPICPDSSAICLSKTSKRSNTRLARRGLTTEAVSRLRSLGLKTPGINAFENNGKLWVGEDGRFKFRLRNTSDQPIIVLFWVGGSGWLNDQVAEVEQSLEPGESVNISTGEEVRSGAFSAIYDDTKVEGQIYNTWGEFTVAPGKFSNINVSRQPYMGGHGLEIQTPSGCQADMERCSFVCKNGLDRCGLPGEYELIGCTPDMNPGAGTGTFWGQPSGGCNMGDEGEITVNFL
jgi:hypothetical protein